MKKLLIVGASLLVVVAIATGCAGGIGPQGAAGPAGPQGPVGPQGPPGVIQAPKDLKFVMAISDNSGKSKNGTPILSLKFENGTPNASTVVAKRGSPIIDGNDGDAGWGPASELEMLIPAVAGGGPTKATVKAAYDTNNIYFLVKWEDPTGTESIHKNMWTYNATTSSWTKSGNEDRVYFLFNINATDFDNGCQVYCHLGNADWAAAEANDSSMGTNNPGERIDVWHWKAHRTNPTSHAEDKHWVDLTSGQEILYENEILLKTRLADSGKGFASGNSAADLPKYMHKDGPGAKTDFLFETDAVTFDPNANWSDGDTIPGYLITEATGSRADVIASASYANGAWVVEFKRSLITNNPDDAQFE